MEAALRGDVIIHEEQGTNVAGGHDIKLGDVDGAFRDAEYTRKEVLKTHRHTGNPMETRGLVASWDAGRNEVTVWGMTKVPHFNRAVLSSLLELPEHRIHFMEPDVGGGFGIRGEFYPEDFLIPYAAMKLGRPVKWIEDRREHLMAANHSREVHCELEIAARRDGTLLGMRAHIHGDMGAHIRTHGGLVPASTAGVLPGPYRIPAYEAHIRCVMTNKMGVGTYRAPGRYESCYFRERMLDMVAEDLGMDPIDLRRKNLIRPEEIPYELGPTRPGIASTVFDSGDYPRALEHALERFGWDELKPLQGQKREGRYHGIGIGWFVKNTGLGPSEGRPRGHYRPRERGRLPGHRHPGPGPRDHHVADLRRLPGRAHGVDHRVPRQHRPHALGRRHLLQPRHRHGRQRRAPHRPSAQEAVPGVGLTAAGDRSRRAGVPRRRSLRRRHRPAAIGRPPSFPRKLALDPDRGRESRRGGAGHGAAVAGHRQAVAGASATFWK